jgi:hypothetical protein
MATNKVIRNLQRRLVRWELEHLRQLTMELQERLELAEVEAVRAADSADFWNRYVMDLQDERLVAAVYSQPRIGLTLDGGLLVVKPDSPEQDAAASRVSAQPGAER